MSQDCRCAKPSQVFFLSKKTIASCNKLQKSQDHWISESILTVVHTTHRGPWRSTALGVSDYSRERWILFLSLSVVTWPRVISFSDAQPLSAMATSSSSLSIRSASLTPASPSAARANTTGRPIWQTTGNKARFVIHSQGVCAVSIQHMLSDYRGKSSRARGLTKTPEAPSAKAFNTSVPRRTPPSRNTGTRPFASLTTWIFLPNLSLQKEKQSDKNVM